MHPLALVVLLFTAFSCADRMKQLPEMHYESNGAQISVITNPMSIRLEYLSQEQALENGYTSTTPSGTILVRLLSERLEYVKPGNWSFQLQQEGESRPQAMRFSHPRTQAAASRNEVKFTNAIALHIPFPAATDFFVLANFRLRNGREEIAHRFLVNAPRQRP